jgi:spore coat polysaccharide biosynthesis protein SpsF (cytidylyltransferase family)
VKVFRGSLLNKIERWADCAENLKVDYIHIVDADDPLVDTDEIRESVDIAQKENCDLLRTSQRSDSGFASVGMTVKRSFLKTLSARTNEIDSNDFDVIPWSLLLRREDRVSEKADKTLIKDLNFNLRLTLDYDEDFLLISHLITKLGATCAREIIESYLFRNPDLVNLNQARSVDFVENKKKQLKSNFGLG